MHYCQNVRQAILAILYCTFFFIFPISLSVYLPSGYLQRSTKSFIWVYIAIVLCLQFNSIKNIKLRFNHTCAILVFLFSLILCCWIIQDLDILYRTQFKVYAGAIILYFLFTKCSDGSFDLLKKVLKMKFVVMFLVSLVFIVYVFILNDEPFTLIKRSPPLYRHLRHFNYDMFFAGIIGVALLNEKKSNKIIFYIALFLVIFLTIWSAARGAIVGYLPVLLFIAFSEKVNDARKQIMTILILVIFSFVIIFQTNIDYLINNTVQYSGIVTDADTFIKHSDTFSAGRVTIWKNSIHKVLDSGWLAVLSGLGPDAFKLSKLSSFAIQPHSLYIQVFLEFGVIGVVAFAIVFFEIVKLCVIYLRKGSDIFTQFLAAGILGTLVFSSVDGLFYHAMPIMTIIVMIAIVSIQSKVND